MAGSSWAQAWSLLDVYQSARQNDPAFRAARYQRDAGRQSTAIARAGLLPNVSITAFRARNEGDRVLIGSGIKQPLDYNVVQDAITLRQPLINYESFVKYQQAGIQVAHSEAVFSAKESELAVRVTTAYLEALLATEKLALSDAEVAAFEEQYRMAQRRMASGEGTLTEIAETESRLRIAEADRAGARDVLTIAVRVLEDMTGEAMSSFSIPSSDSIPAGIQPDDLDTWMSIAQEHSPIISSQRRLFESARMDVNRNRAGHLPRLDLVASITHSENDSVALLNQKISNRSIGVQLTVPLFTGWGVMAQTDQAIANRERLSAELDATVNEVLVEVRRQFLNSRTSITKVSAYRKAVEASLTAVEGTRKAMAAGIRTNANLLDAQREMFSAKKDLAQARYEFLGSQIRLKAVAGILSENDVADVDRVLVSEAPK
jgi:protease secretion system outer membrane protein